MKIVCEKILSGLRVVVVYGDLLDQEVDAIVNPANSLMIMGGGVAAAIKERGGAEIEAEARSKAPVPVGEAIITSGGRLKARYIIHAPTMERPAMRTSSEKVRRATDAALRKAVELGLKKIALPGMGTGIGGLSYSKAARVMVETITRYASSSLGEVRLVARDLALARAFCRELLEAHGTS